MKIEVTQQHISEGVGQDCEACPIALAMKDMGWRYPHVDTTNARAWAPDIANVLRLVKWSLPQEAKDFTEKFDAGENVAPLTFEAKHIYGYTTP